MRQVSPRPWSRRSRSLPRRATFALAVVTLSATLAALPTSERPASAGTTVVDARLYAPTSKTPSVRVAGIGIHPDGRGYWLAAADGRVLSFGSAVHSGPTSKMRSRGRVVDITHTPKGNGYWLATSTGKVRAYGTARSYGSVATTDLDAPIVAIAATPTGRGYWLAGRDGGVFALGDARFHGSARSLGVQTRIVGIAPSRRGGGYYLASADGGVYAFGDARFHGSATRYKPDSSVTSIALSRTGRGYWLATRNGSVFAFGDAPYLGGLGGRCPDVPVAAISGGPLVRGYWISLTNGGAFAFAPGNGGKGRCGGTRTQRAARDIFMQADAERAARGLPALTWDARLARHARSWSNEMARSGFRHSDLTPLIAGSPPRFNSVAENIASGRGPGVTSATMHAMWLRSDGHRANMLHPGLEAMGVGVVCGPDGTLWATQNLGRYYTSGPGPGSTTPPAGNQSSYAGRPVSC